MSEETHATAVLAALNTGGTVAYEVDTLKKMTTLPANYVEVSIFRRYGGENRNTGSTGRTGWRVAARAVGITVSNARVMRETARTRLEYARITVSGDKSTPVQFETDDVIADDEGKFSGLSTYTYAI